MNDTEKSPDSEETSGPKTAAMQRADGLLKLSHQMMTQYHERRNLEWRIHVLLWTLLVAGAYFIVKVGINVQPWKWAVLLVFVLLVHIIWTLKMQLGEIRDQDLSVQYRKAAQAVIVGEQSVPSIVEPDEERSPMPLWLRKLLHGYWLWNIVVLGTTAVMGIAIAFVVYSGASGGTRTMPPRLPDLALQMQNLQQDQRVTALELKQIRAELEALQQASVASPGPQPSSQRQR